jgi:hypothetical protein
VCELPFGAVQCDDKSGTCRGGIPDGLSAVSYDDSLDAIDIPARSALPDIGWEQPSSGPMERLR